MPQSVRYSQNFLRPAPWLESLIERSSLTARDTVIDIGAGSGSMTKPLARLCQKVIAIEADPRLASNLRTTFATSPNVTVIMNDFLSTPLPKEAYKVFANIPFNRTSDIVHRLLDAPNPPIDCYLILQLEAADKFAGLNGRQSLFSIVHAPWFGFEVVHRFQPNDFIPKPSVAVIMLRSYQRSNPVITPDHRPLYEDFVSYIFNHANPNILPALRSLFTERQFEDIVANLGQHVTAKPSQLSPAAWLFLFQMFHQSQNVKQLQLVRGLANKLRNEASAIEKYHRTRLSKQWRSESKQ